MQIQVYIATTQGPVAVQKLTKEDNDVPPTAGVNGGGPAAISNHYYDFVKKGTGVIARDFGHAAWRADLSGDIEQGKSWQLALYLAHQLHHQSLLFQDQEAVGDLIIWTTGEVKYDLSIGAIDGLDKKITASSAFLSQLLQEGKTVVALVPRANLLAPLTDATELFEEVTTGLTESQRGNLTACAIDEIPDNLQLSQWLNMDADTQAHRGGKPARQSGELLATPSDDRVIVRGLKKGYPFLLLILTLSLVFWGGCELIEPQLQPQSNPETGLESKEDHLSTSPADRTQQDDSMVAGLDDFGARPAVSDPGVKPADLTLQVMSFGQGGTCETARSDILLPEVGPTYSYFSATPLNNLCRLMIHSTQEIDAENWLAVSLDSGALIPISQASRQAVQIPLPQKRDFDRHYAVFIGQSALNPAQRHRLRAYVQAAGQDDVTTDKGFSDLIAHMSWQGRWYRHRLIGY